MKTHIILVPAGKNTTARKVCENIEGMTFPNRDIPELKSLEGVVILRMSDFMDLVNDDEGVLSRYFMTYVNFES